LEDYLKLEFETCRTSFLLATCCLVLATLSCGPLTPVLGPTPTLISTTVAPTEPPSATPLPSPTPTRTPTPTPTPIPPTAPCPPPGSPTLDQPTSFTAYPDAIQAYLSAGGDLETLRARLGAWGALPDGEQQLTAADLNGDGTDEVILSLVDPQGHVIAPSGVLLVFECAGEAYQRLHRGGRGDSEAFDPSVEILQVGDVTLDGLPDVVYVLRNCGAHTCYERLRILGWDGAQLVDRIGGALELPYPTYNVEPGTIEAISGGIGSVGAEPQRGYAEIWAWNGAIFTRTKEIYQPPVYRYHALLDGDRALRAGDYLTATRAYERVINDDALEEWGGITSMMTPAEERAQLSAFARWRLVLTYLLTDRPDEAQTAYDSLQRDYPAGPGGDVARMARTFWEAYQPQESVSAGCAATVAQVEAYSSVLDFFTRNYGYANPFWELEDLCPF
jgi:hypothetical protein